MKPDNCFLFLGEVGTNSSPSIAGIRMALGDFGRAIDLRLMPEGARLKGDWQAEGFACPQSLSGEPWTIEADYFGIVACAHVLLFSKYMELGPDCMPREPLKRYWQVDMWNALFDACLSPLSSPPEKARALAACLKSMEVVMSSDVQKQRGAIKSIMAYHVQRRH